MTLREFNISLSIFEGVIVIKHYGKDEKWHDVRVFKNGAEEMWDNYLNDENNRLFDNEVNWFSVRGKIMVVCI